ncbi:hypothetical protein ACSSNL_02395 [Thalassobius sp. S69A]|uniref:hypothetical protein n=1 Tax=unclassified Thalassovita TaxID=2619711 RepID=UPI003C7CBF06
MTKLKMISAACLMAVAGAPAMANGPAIYPYATTANYCPGGLQPISINGVICCGTPNQSMTYQQATSAPVKRSYRPTKARSAICPEGEKGCYYK